MELFKETYLTILPIITTSLMGYIIWLLQEQRKEKKKLDDLYAKRHQEEVEKREANANGTKLILFYMLQRLHTEYMYYGYTNHEDRTLFKEIYDAYHGLGGNGYGTRMWEDVKALPIRNDINKSSPFYELLKVNDKLKEMQKGNEFD